jgi:hypothetical protein
MTGELLQANASCALEGEKRAKEISALHREIRWHARVTLEKAIRIGELLTQQKQALPHGEFTPWLRANVPFTERTATNYMRVFEKREELKSENVSVLRQAYKLLQASSESASVALRQALNEQDWPVAEFNLLLSSRDWEEEISATTSVERCLEIHRMFEDWERRIQGACLRSEVALGGLSIEAKEKFGIDFGGMSGEQLESLALAADQRIQELQNAGLYDSGGKFVEP